MTFVEDTDTKSPKFTSHIFVGTVAKFDNICKSKLYLGGGGFQPNLGQGRVFLIFDFVLPEISRSDITDSSSKDQTENL